MSKDRHELPWIKMRVSLPADPRVSSMAGFLLGEEVFRGWLDQMGVTRDANVTVIVTVCVTGLLRVWGMANDIGHVTGNDLIVENIGTIDLDHTAGFPCFGEAMASIGWAIEESGPIVRFPKYATYNTPVERRDKTAAERMARHRQRQKDEKATRGSDAQRYAQQAVTVTTEERRARARGEESIPSSTKRDSPDSSGSDSSDRQHGKLTFDKTVMPFIVRRSPGPQQESDRTVAANWFDDIWPEAGVTEECAQRLSQFLGLCDKARRKDNPMAWLTDAMKRAKVGAQA